MTYVEKMTNRFTSIYSFDSNMQPEDLINQIIADTKRACEKAITNNLSLHPNTWNNCMDAIDQAEVKGAEGNEQ